MTGERKEIAGGHYRKLRSIQGLRGVAFILIFLSHTEMVIAGALGAELFLVISGFVMMLAYNEKDKILQTGKIIDGIKFSASKINRLYLLHMFMLVGIAIVMWMQLLMGEASVDILISQLIFFLCNALLIQSWIPNSEAYFSYNAVSWYLSVCTFLYFLFPWTLKKLKRKSNHSLIGILIGDGIIRIGLALIVCIIPNQSIIIGGGIKWFTYICPIYRFGDFLYGCILGLLFLREREKEFQKDNTSMEIVGVILTLTQIFIYTKYNVPLIIKYSLYWAPLSMMLLWLAVHENGAISKILCKKVMVYIGDMSAVYFLIHQAIIKFTEYIIPNDKILLSLASLVIVMFTAFIYIEIVKAVQRIKYVRR